MMGISGKQSGTAFLMLSIEIYGKQTSCKSLSVQDSAAGLEQEKSCIKY